MRSFGAPSLDTRFPWRSGGSGTTPTVWWREFGKRPPGFRLVPLGVAVVLLHACLAGAEGAATARLVSDPGECANATAPLTAQERVFAGDLLKGEAGDLLSVSSGVLAAGRYRVHVPLAIAPFGDPNISDLAVSVTAGQVERTFQVADFPGSHLFADAALDFAVASSEPVPIRVRWSIGPRARKFRLENQKRPEGPDVGKADGDGSDDLAESLEKDNDGAVGADGLSRMPCRLVARRPLIETLPPLAVTRIRSRKVLYSPGEQGSLEVRVRNHAASAESGHLQVCLLRGLGDREVLLERTVALDPRKDLVLDVPFKATGRWGVTARAVMVQGGSTNTADDEFSVSEHVWEVGIGYATPVMTQSGKFKGEELVATMRARHSNWIDIFFWAPCDWARLVPEGRLWWSGQASYAEDEVNLRDLIGRLHAQGMKASAYASCNPAGPYGWEAYRRHPEWFTGPGNWDVECLDKWNDQDWRKQRDEAKAGNPGWFRLGLDLRRLEPVDYGIGQIIESAKHFGWDAVRFDGHYKTGDDALSTRNMRRLKERVWEAVPGFALGFNYGRAPEWAGGITHEMREGMAGGGLYMQEGIRNWRHTADQYQSWSFYATNELRIAKQVQAMGGYYHCIWELDSPKLSPAQRYYKLVYGLIAGGHPCYGSHYAAPGCLDWGAFITRWSAVLWDRNLRVVPDPSKSIRVESPGVQWEAFVQERVESATRKQVIVHLVNPPTSDSIAQGEFPPAFGKPIVVSFRPDAGASVKRAALVRPDAQPFDQLLPVEPAGDGVRVTVPAMRHWALVVWELDGNFQVPPEPAKFTEPPRPVPPAQAAAAGAVRVDPNRDAAEDAGAHAYVVAFDHGSPNIGKPMVGDADSLQGMVQGRREDQASARLGLWWIPLNSPGKYRLSAAVKWTDAQAEPVPQRLDISLCDHENWEASEVKTILVTPGYADPPAGAVTLAPRGQYHFYPVGMIDKRKPGCVNFVCQATTAKAGGNALYLERLKFELLEPYTDSLVAAQAGLPEKPQGLRNPAGAAPAKTLFVKGMFWQSYLQGVTIPMDFRYACPTNYEDLYGYDAVVLCNLPAPELSQRKMLKDFAEDGGRVTILGGVLTLGQGVFQNTFLDDILPVVLTGADEVVRLDPPALLGPGKATGYGDKAGLFWCHQIVPRKDSQILAWAGDRPIALARHVGKGWIYVFAGTVLGEGTPEVKPFWECPSWQGLLKTLVAAPPPSPTP